MSSGCARSLLAIAPLLAAPARAVPCPNVLDAAIRTMRSRGAGR